MPETPVTPPAPKAPENQQPAPAPAPAPAPVAPVGHVNDSTLPVGNPMQWAQQQAQQAEQKGEQLVSTVEVPWTSALVVGGLIVGLIALYYFAPTIRGYLEQRGIFNNQAAAPAGEAPEEGFEEQGEE